MYRHTDSRKQVINATHNAAELAALLMYYISEELKNEACGSSIGSLDSLDKMYWEDVFFDQISAQSFTEGAQPVTSQAVLVGQAIKEFLDRQPDEQARELAKILTSPHIQSLLAAHDDIAFDKDGTDSNRLQCQTDQGPDNQSWWNNTDLVISAHNMDRQNREKVVKFQRNSEEPLGITLKVEPSGCSVARILHGGMVHEQGFLHVGDEILEINCEAVEHQTPQYLQQILKEARGTVSMKIITSARNSISDCQMFVRSMFSYNPNTDDLNPCKPAGLKFNIRDIIQIIDREDPDYWQAKLYSSPSGDDTNPAGLIPSPKMQETRIVCQSLEAVKQKQSEQNWWNKKRKTAKEKYLVKHSSAFEPLDILTYEEVTLVQDFKFRTLVLLGAHGVGRRHIKNVLIAAQPQRFAYPVPHTSRKPGRGEDLGKNYHFVSHDEMINDIVNNEYLEYGTHENAMYGTKLETVRKIHEEGKIAILDVEPQALLFLRNHQYAPYVILIQSPTSTDLNSQEALDCSIERLIQESITLEQSNKHFIDLNIINTDIDNSIRRIEHSLTLACTTPQWIPVSWVF